MILPQSYDKQVLIRMTLFHPFKQISRYDMFQFNEN